MAPLVVVDAGHVERLGRELLVAADLLNGFSGRLSRLAGGTGDSYGSLPESAAAAEQHDQAARSALDCLRKLEKAYDIYATQLRLAARSYEAAEDDNATIAAQLAAGID